MKNILVPTDFSQQSRAAYKTATDIAAKNNGKIVLLHVLYFPALYHTGIGVDPLGYDPVYLSALEEDAKKELEKMEADVSGYTVDVNPKIVVGDLMSAIKETIENHHIDLVVMGTAGTSGLTEMFIGSNTEKVIRNAAVPVLAIRRSIKISSIKNIVLPSTLDLNQAKFIDKVKEIQEFFEATLHILLINTPANFRRDAEADDRLKKFVRHYNLKNCNTHFRNYFHEEDGIIDFARKEKMDLIAMATHGLTGLGHLFIGSTTEDVVNHIEIPVLTYALKNLT